jgi:Ca2+-binding RTX toxin-like protein
MGTQLNAMLTAMYTPAAVWTPMEFMVAVLAGMPHKDIVAGLADGRVIPPPGMPVGWVPPAWSGEDLGLPATSAASVASASATTGTTTGTATDSDTSSAMGSINSSSTSDSSSSDHSSHIALDRDHVAGLYKSLDPALGDEGFGRLWTNAGDADDGRASSLFSYLRRTLLGASDALPAADDNKYADAVDSSFAQLKDFLAANGHQGTVVDLSGKSGSELADLAKTDAGYRYALKQLDSMAIVGSGALMTIHDANHELDRFDPDTGEANLSDAWISDRAKLLAWKLRTDAGGDAKSDDDQGWTFIDRSTLAADGKPLRIEVAGKNGDALRNQVIFGNDAADGELLKGGAGTDRVYGGGGDDVLRGRAGNDHLEGGKGDDLVMGGIGDDELTGDQGDDELDGGAGKDKLSGGSGDDTLTGGRGDDRMDGGVGHDIYAIDPGDGTDTIIDSDGDGEVQFDGATLSGAKSKNGSCFVSDDGKVLYSFSGDAEEGGTLTISVYDHANPGDTDAPTNTIKIKDWKNGDLGISLGDGSAGALSTFTDAIATGDGSAGSGSTGASTGGSTGDTGGGGDAGGSDGSSGGNSGGAGMGADGSDGNGADSGSGNAGAAADSTSAMMDPSGSAAANDNASAVDALLNRGFSDFAGSLLRPENVAAALRAFDGVPEAPDVPTTHADAASPVGVTAHDISTALMDFHDSGTDMADHGGIGVNVPSIDLTRDVMPQEIGSGAASAPDVRVVRTEGRIR